ncbi:CPBP family intramembrane glutamic endopeptidase [Sphingomonas sp. G-3-2-10]|uniref:CPBP family glutamic-type intramembrane protease n=1 Tax=Sphingomonas sp. G-3-2-10 TaxID=2728838 RepID=UPI0019D05720
MTQPIAVALLVFAAAMLTYFVRDDVREFALFKALTTSEGRQRRYLIWVAKSFGLFSGSALIGLALLGRFDAILTLPAEFGPALAALPKPDFAAGELPLLAGLMIGAAIGGGILGALIASRRKDGKAPMAGDVEALLPRNGRETLCGALLSLNAGATEELFFRLYLPLLLVLAGLNPVAAFVVAAIVFGLVHLYQGAAGVLATGVLGAALTLAYLLSGSLALPILLHVAIDLNALVVRPTLTRLMRRAKSP